MLYNMTYFDIVYLCIKVRLYCSGCLCSFNLYSDVLRRNKKRREDWHWLTVLIFKKTHSSFICKVGAMDNHCNCPFLLYVSTLHESLSTTGPTCGYWYPIWLRQFFTPRGAHFGHFSGLDYPIQKKHPRKELSCAPLTILILLLGDIITQFLISLATSQYSQ